MLGAGEYMRVCVREDELYIYKRLMTDVVIGLTLEREKCTIWGVIMGERE